MMPRHYRTHDHLQGFDDAGLHHNPGNGYLQDTGTRQVHDGG